MRIGGLMGEVPPAACPPVLCYHRVGGPLELGVTRVGSSIFARQMTTLARAGWKTLTLDQFAERLQREGLPPCPCQRRHLTREDRDRKSTRLNSSHLVISYAVFCLKKKKSSNGA